MESLIKFLRESRNLSKKDIYEDLISEQTYTKIENNTENATLYIMTLILKRLNVSFHEFSYLYSKSKNITNFYDDLNNELSQQLVFIDEFIQKYPYLTSFQKNILKGLSTLYEGTGHEQEKYREIIWKTIKNNENLLPNDIILLSYIFFLFKDKQQEFIIKEIKEKMDLWEDYYGISKTISLFYFNLGVLYNLVHEDNEMAIKYYEIAINKGIKHQTPYSTARAMIELGKINNNEDLKVKGTTILSVFHPEILDLL
ncbi:helix-turn-helix domain-containing protein [Macrococcoides canis]|uniref:Helix-turn-helix domain-containing protein n=1 Tax=Macrococcoides canis TaxID=1855823 RepID=A0A6G7EVI3_9STAP|nr:helix-turn-helix transcriptional regulator [Macrococcus canis]QHW12309.1 helix-turn-helix transcriptional regulator [Macrococcus canis]QIH77394.1 helix-turn-helix domain-containing protein [Macrococcus canis]